VKAAIVGFFAVLSIAPAHAQQEPQYEDSLSVLAKQVRACETIGGYWRARAEAAERGFADLKASMEKKPDGPAKP
jgi:hypothetical protein